MLHTAFLVQCPYSCVFLCSLVDIFLHPMFDFCVTDNTNKKISYEQQSLAVHDIFPSLPKYTEPDESPIMIKISSLDTKNEDDDSCFTEDDGDDDLQFELNY